MRFLFLLIAIFYTTSSWGNKCKTTNDTKEKEMRLVFKTFQPRELNLKLSPFKDCSMDGPLLIDNLFQENNDLNTIEYRNFNRHSNHLSLFINNDRSKIERIRTSAIEINESKALPPRVRKYISNKKLILVGEIHGNEESPKFFMKIVNSFIGKNKKILVALEIPILSQENINAYLKTRNENYLRNDFFFNRKDQDGRSSKAMVNLLRSLSRIPGIEVVCMDEQNVDAQFRDTLMAKNISEKFKLGFDHILVYAGNIHSSIVIGAPWDSSFRPLGFELIQILGFSSQSILNIRFRHEILNSWMCMGHDNICKVYLGHSVKTDYSEAVPWRSYFFEEDEIVDGYKSTLFIRETKASNPYVFQ